ncbi:hypothetical protein WJX74_001960 [Apatococcus lobatus]|uniref:VWFD domain-containing protein n=1 Tax=Apatococcus lobatus TaxID=904363 RepID=A0AAW1RAQ6_9CHLO
MLLLGRAGAQTDPKCPAPTQEGLCSRAVATVALRAEAVGVQAAVICTINPGLDVLTPALPLTTSSNGAIVTSGVTPIIAIQPVPFVGTFTVTYPAEPALQCPGSGILGIGATVVQCTIACDATNTGTVVGEPHFIGFDGSRYDFQGIPGEHYSLLTDNEHNLNAQFVKRSQRLDEDTQEWFNLPSLEDKATWLGAVGLTFKDDTAHVSHTQTGKVTVEVNGHALASGTSEVTTGGLSVMYTNTTVADGSLWVHPGPFTLPTVTITTDRYEFVVSIPLNHDKRLDLSSRVISAPNAKIAPAEGVLGQTLAVLYGTPLDSAFDQADMMEVWDPEEGDHLHHSAKLEEFLTHNFRVSSLFANDALKTHFQKGLEHAYFQAQAVGEAAGADAIAHNVSSPEEPKTVARRFLAEQVNINVAEELHISAGVLSR